ncbi:MAG: HPr family phosphocarrier protein [Clostridiales bacterium]|jgi:phosphocarrier protein HPr|nr:HPr family phosphocarrier protein [Clostridiales bacterium]
MKELRYVITDEIGLHARPAGLLVSTASKFDCNIKIKNKTKETDAKSILGVMSLGVRTGEEIILTFDGEDEEKAYEAIKTFLEANL